MATIDQKYYKTKEIRELLGVTKLTVHNWISSGKLAAVKAGGQYRISEKALKDFLDTRKDGFRIACVDDKRYHRKRSAEN